MLKNMILFRLEDFTLSKAQLEDQLLGAPFTPCARLQAESKGFSAPAGDSELVREVNGNLLFQVTMEERKINAKALALQLANKIEEFRNKNGGAQPDKKSIRSMKADIMLNMLPQVFPERKSIRVFIPASREFIAVDSSSQNTAEDILSFAYEYLGSPQRGALLPLKTVEEEVTGWITSEKTPDGVKLEESLTLKGFADSSSVTCKNVPPFGEEVANHIRQNRKVTTFKVTLNENTTFSVNNKLAVKSISFGEDLVAELPEEHGEMAPEVLMAYLIDTNLSLQSKEYAEIFNFIKTNFAG